MKHTLPFVLACLSASLATAQQAPLPLCKVGHPDLLPSLHHNDPAIVAGIEQAEAELEEFTRLFAEGYMEGERATHTIPVVFHIIHNNGPENISDAQVHDAMRILNEDFNKLNPDWDNVNPAFLSLVADVGVEFKLARKDPQGNCTNGITRTVSTLTYQGNDQMKALIQWPRNRYLNVWVAASADGAAGYTLTPGAAAFLSSQDGIVMLHSYVGSIGTSNPSTSRALTHEVGHWINLQHTWGGSNTPGVQSNCNTDDGVSDTPNTIGWTSCNVNGNTCNSLDNVENYMEYSYCSKMFTAGQKTRMIAALNSSTAQRNNLSTASNLTFTGVNQPDVLCVARFSQSATTICQGTTVTFSDESFHGVVSRTWSFPGGTPSSSTDANPSVTYDTPGTYNVTLTVSDGTNQLSTTTQNAVRVLAVPGGSVPFTDGFEDYTNLGSSPWQVQNGNNDNTWELTTAAAHSGSKSLRIVNTASMDGRKDDLFSTTYDMSGATQAVITFRYAFARRASGNDDRLRVYVSNNCGNTWVMRKQLRGSTDLTTGGTVSGSFVPNADQWGYAVVDNIPSSYHVSNFRVRFEFESNGGNNVYLDDININNQPVGLETLTAGPSTLMVLPNPVEGEAQAVFTLDAPARVKLDVLDLLGQVVGSVHEGPLPSGTHRFGLPTAHLASGMYFLRLRQGDALRTVRFVVR